MDEQSNNEVPQGETIEFDPDQLLGGNDAMFRYEQPTEREQKQLEYLESVGWKQIAGDEKYPVKFQRPDGSGLSFGRGYSNAEGILKQLPRPSVEVEFSFYGGGKIQLTGEISGIDVFRQRITLRVGHQEITLKASRELIASLLATGQYD